MRRTTWVGVAVLVAPWMIAAPGAPASAVEPTCAGQPATIVGTDGSDSLTGTDGPDVVYLGAGDDEFYDSGGDDLACGGPGNDTLRDGAEDGRDEYYGEDGADTLWQIDSDLVDGGAGDDRLFVPLGGQSLDDTGDVAGGPGSDWISLALGSSEGVVVDVPRGTITGGGSYTISGLERWLLTPKNDAFRGGPKAETVSGFVGEDQLSLGAGNDRVIVGGSDSILRMGRGADRVHVERTGQHRVWLGPGPDTARIDGGGGRTHLFAGSGDDHVTVTRPNFFDARGASGRDFLDFQRSKGFGPVRLDAGAGKVRLDDGTVHKFAGFERYRGSRDSDTLIGSSERDWIHGSDARDVIRGRGGNDVLIGGGGPDVIRGGGGRDVCDRGNTRGCERLR